MFVVLRGCVRNLAYHITGRTYTAVDWEQGVEENICTSVGYSKMHNENRES
jgi:hypothetical protein